MDETPARWEQDPYGRHELRYWDGTRWTEHVSSGGAQTIDDPDAVLPTEESSLVPVADMATAEQSTVEPSWAFAPVEEPPVAPVVDMATGADQPSRRRRWPWIAGIAAAFLLGVGIGGLATSTGGGGRSAPAPQRLQFGGRDGVAAHPVHAAQAGTIERTGWRIAPGGG